VNEHVTVFPLVVFPLVVHPAGSTESTVNPDGNWSTRGMPMMQLGLSIHRSVMVKVIGSPTVAVLGAVLSRQSSPILVQEVEVSCDWAGLPIPNSITPLTASTAIVIMLNNSMVRLTSAPFH
jgi:hypothetical protein